LNKYIELFKRQRTQEEAQQRLTHEKLRIQEQLKNIQNENRLLKLNTSTDKSNENLNDLNNALKTLKDEILIQNNELIQEQEVVKILNFKNKELEKNNKILSDSLLHSREELKILYSNQSEKNNKVIYKNIKLINQYLIIMLRKKNWKWHIYRCKTFRIY
jgi:hypothetical protein